MNLESGEFIQLYETEFVTFTNSSYNGSVPVDDYEAEDVVYPQYVSLASSTKPAGNISPPPGKSPSPLASVGDGVQYSRSFISNTRLGEGVACITEEHHQTRLVVRPSPLFAMVF